MTDGRPKTRRIIRKKPGSFRFSPKGRRGKPKTVFLKMEEFEAIRLADYEFIAHKEAAYSMGVSRQTFERVLKIGRETIADAIVNGKIIKIWGGTYDFGDLRI